MSHADRVKLVLRAPYFLDSWSTALDIAGYNKNIYFLSREAVDISRIIIEGYLSLLYIHRDHIVGLFPLLPWLHSSEACEHVFGESRRIVKDFTMLDFLRLYMIPKLRVKLRAAILRAKSADGKACATGYSHSYFDNTGLDIHSLSTFPSDEEISSIALEVAEESDSLIALLGLAPSQLYTGAIPVMPILPNISSWYDPDDFHDDSEDSDLDSLSEAQQLQALLDKAEHNTVSRTKMQAKELLDLTSVALALSAEDMIKIHSLPDNGDEILDEIAAEEHANIQAMINIPTLPLILIISSTYDDAIRPSKLPVGYEPLKEDQDQKAATGTGLERTARWRAPAPGGQNPSDQSAAGNSANAAGTATVLANKASAKRKDIFTKSGVPNLPEIIGARVSLFRPIRIGDYGVILTTRGVMVAHVFGMNAKGGGKYGKHEPVTESSNISALSKISVQVFENLHGAQFSSITATPTGLPTGLELAPEDPERFKKLVRAESKLNDAMKLFRKRGKRNAGAGDSDAEDDCE
ncbi:hypothetical protein DFH07DRAFT_1058377 [Mycena maculata]|uniref:Uncharacterized protein n=1 Tax=Mycena maculata TaxID=230809 RepID=A0AAD7JQ71_9AGAR|nr:hypothetical protein DFH07DRAFT_1058377 [Mycena maculata]